MFHENNIKWTEKIFIVPVGVKKYPLIITKTTEKWVVHIRCDWANIDQSYLAEDLHLLFEDIAWMIEEHQLEKKDNVFQMRLTSKQKLELEKNAQKEWYNYISDFVKSCPGMPAVEVIQSCSVIPPWGLITAPLSSNWNPKDAGFLSYTPPGPYSFKPASPTWLNCGVADI